MIVVYLDVLYWMLIINSWINSAAILQLTFRSYVFTRRTWNQGAFESNTAVHKIHPWGLCPLRSQRFSRRFRSIFRRFYIFTQIKYLFGILIHVNKKTIRHSPNLNLTTFIEKVFIRFFFRFENKLWNNHHIMCKNQNSYKKWAKT